MPSSAVVATLIADPRSMRFRDCRHRASYARLGGLDSRRWLAFRRGMKALRPSGAHAPDAVIARSPQGDAAIQEP
jgi:hypothetical protein